mgnify:CR=1 FL=1
MRILYHRCKPRIGLLHTDSINTYLEKHFAFHPWCCVYYILSMIRISRMASIRRKIYSPSAAWAFQPKWSRSPQTDASPSPVQKWSCSGVYRSMTGTRLRSSESPGRTAAECRRFPTAHPGRLFYHRILKESDTRSKHADTCSKALPAAFAARRKRY